MKRLGRLESLALAAGMFCAACSSGGGGGNSGGNGPGGGGNSTDDPMPTVNPDSFKRNPSEPLACDRTLFENPAATQLSRLTHGQYVNTMRDLFAGLVDSADLPQRKDLPDELVEGTFSNNVLRQAGSTEITAAREKAVLAASAAAVKDLPKLMGCQAKDSAAESACVDTFLDGFGARAWRRPLTSDERGAVKSLFTEARKTLEFTPSVQTVLGAMLESPQFLYQVQEGTGDVLEGKRKRLSDFEVASSLSYLLWNSMPDSELFGAAKKGELATSAQVEKQALRMLNDPRARENIHQFQREWMKVERLDSQARAGVKDKTVFPNYTTAQSDALLQGLDAFLENSFWEGDHSIKQLFTSTKGFVNDDSADIYGVKKPGSAKLVSVDLDATKRKGILTQPYIMAGWSSDKAQSAILRGAFIMEKLLCAPSPPPPMGVVREFVKVPDRNAVTLRQVVEMTVEKGTCAGCHKTMDAFGFLFENYDGIGAYQEKERDLKINASAEVVDTFDLNARYDNGIQFSEALGKSEQVAQCAVQTFYEFATARLPVPEDGCMIAPLTDAFIKNGTDMKQLLVEMVKSPAFRYRTAAQ
jgi:hypothetical protein